MSLTKPSAIRAITKPLNCSFDCEMSKHITFSELTFLEVALNALWVTCLGRDLFLFRRRFLDPFRQYNAMVHRLYPHEHDDAFYTKALVYAFAPEYLRLTSSDALLEYDRYNHRLLCWGHHIRHLCLGEAIVPLRLRLNAHRGTLSL